MTNILLGVTGGIASYKSPDLVRRLKERGADVQVVMTAGAREFVTPMTFQAVSGREVRTDLWDEEAEAAMGHIELARWADQILIAPASADFISRLTHGSGGDLLSTVCLASEAKLSIAPAMNQQMWANSAVQANIALLRERGVNILGPGVGDQACGETGAGRMLEPTDLADKLLTAQDGVLAGKHVLITAGPTREAIDPVRYITNRSSGKMGFAMARAMQAAGAQVSLIAGPVALPTPPGVDRVNVESAEQMYAAVHAAVGSADVFVATAAVADYRPAQMPAHKIKKSDAALQIELTPTKDILASVAALPKPPFTVGFAAETQNLREYALKKLHGKALNMIVANEVGDKLAFDQDDNAATVYWADGEQNFARESKRELARHLTDLIAEKIQAGLATARNKR